MAGDDIRLTYVALTRAQSQVVAWWSPSWDEPNGGISRLLRGRRPDQQLVPDRVEPKHSEDEVKAIFDAWAARGGPVVEPAVVVEAPAPAPLELPDVLAVRSFTRRVDTDWRRTSYSALVRSAEQQIGGVGSEPAEDGKDDEAISRVLEPAVCPEEGPEDGPDADSAVGSAVGSTMERVTASPTSPMAGLPAGAAFGSLVHAVLERTDPDVPDLATELREHVRTEASYWAVTVPEDDLVDGLIPLHDTPLGPLADDLTLRRIPIRDRLRELDFEIPLAGGDLAGAESGDLLLGEMAPLLLEQLDRKSTRLNS